MRSLSSFFVCTLAFAMMGSNIYANEIFINTPDGEMFVFDIDTNESLQTLQEKVVALSNGKESNLLIEMPSQGRPRQFALEASRSQGGYLGYPRSYYAEVTPEEKNDIRFIVTTLANKSLISIALAKGELEAAGDRIDHIHPLRFLMTVFTDEELKAGIRNIRGRGWIWSHFTGSLKDCLSVEANLGNMEEAYIFNFASIVKINTALILPAIQQQSWDNFIDLLITHIPRSGDHDRYDT